MKHKLLKLKALLVVLMMAVGFGQAWADDVTGTITFSSNAVKINAASVQGADDLSNTWQITTVGTTSYTANSAYYQVGSSSKPATSITFTTTLPAEQTITSMSAKFGGFSGTAGTITLKVGDTTVGTGSLSATSDVEVSNTSEASGNVLTVTVTGISKGVKVYYISYTYSEGSTPTVHTLTYSATNGSIGGVVYGTSTPVESGASVAEGGKVTLTATPSDGYEFSSWSVEGTGSSLSSTTDNPTTFTMGTADATVTINFEAIPTHTATFSVNGNTTAQDFAEGASITFPEDPDDVSGKKFVGWAKDAITGTTDEAPSFVTSATMSTNAVTYYAVFADVSGSTAESWTETTIDNISSSDVIVISNGTYAMNNDGGASNAPTTNSITVTGTSLSTAPNNNLKWNVSGNSTNGYTFYPNGETDKWLYCNTTSSSKNNDNIRVGTGDRKVWAFDDNGYLVTNDNYTARYLSIYNSQDFRGYVNTTNGFVPKFYKHIAATATYANYCTSVVITAGSISITADNPVNIVTAGGSYDLALAYDNLTINSNSDFAVQFYDANDVEIADPDWIEVTVEDAEPSGYKVSYTVSANTVTTARSAYFKVYASDVNSDLAYSNKVTITQAAKPVTPPTIGLPSGLYPTTQSVTITTKEDGGTTYYTTDGSDPTNESDEYTSAISITETTTLKAITYVGDNYSSISSETYTIFVVEDGVFDFVKAGEADYDYGSGVEKTNNSNTYVTEPKTWTSGNVTMVTARVSGSGYRWWSNNNTLRFYNESTATFSVPDGYAIIQIVTTGANFDSADKGELSSGTWTGLSKEVKLTATGSRYVNTITVTYVPIETVTVGTAGYATYASDHNLDFTKTNIKAYIATTRGNGTGVAFTQINKVPAGTGVLLYVDDGATEAIPVFDPAKEDADGTDGNKFVRGTGGTIATDDGVNYNYILNNGVNGIGFYKANNKRVAVNRAYICIPKDEIAAADAKDFFSMPGFDDDPTGINDLADKTGSERNEIYNLAGQRINKLQKGINIINGKKIMK